MNFKKQAEKLEHFLEHELKSKLPLLPLKDGSIVYKTYKIKQNQQGSWELMYYRGDKVDSFNLKVSAILGAKFHFSNQLDTYNRVKNLDIKYWTNSFDAAIFNERHKNCKDIAKKTVYFSRWELTKSRATRYKEQIQGMFARNFT